MAVDVDGFLDEAEQLEEEAAAILAASHGHRHGKRVAMQQEAARLRKVARGIRNEANAARQLEWDRVFVRQAARILTRPQFEMIKAAADVHHRGTDTEAHCG